MKVDGERQPRRWWIDYEQTPFNKSRAAQWNLPLVSCTNGERHPRSLGRNMAPWIITREG